ncbi:tol-pal system protein YbgF [Formivibrio citricus]|uniref:Cell division coordinator CpoB n=1 Tax=Formivibrio citricus TaxID=83765 RepID=A0A1I4ZHS8_9NEIS|nr:YbgF trimerization domain-containing protein [Formivibrio citricus]SFN49707.1 tol-pal system protein YbgF [Formivibrio citricus]
MKRIAAIVLAGMAFSAHAAFFSDDEARQQINELRVQAQKTEERLTQLEAVSKQSIELLNQLEKLREDLAGLQGKIEVLQFNQDEAVKRQKDLYVDLDTRVRNIELAKQQAVQAEEKAKTERQADELKQLDAGVKLVKSGKNKEGIAILAKFAKDNPDSPKHAEALYWMGAGHAAMKNYKAANQAFGQVANKAADDPRAPDALLGLASVAMAQKDKKGARKYLLLIVEKYPQSEAAVTAKKALMAN